MKYEVVDAAGRVMMTTTDPRCTYPADLERAMRRAGYKVRRTDGEKAAGPDSRR